MKNSIAKLALFSLVAVSLIGSPAVSRAQEASTNAAAAKPAAKKNTLPFNGKISSLDASGATVTVGKLTLNVTSTTKITKDGSPAALSDLTVGEKITGSYKKDAAGKLNATVIHAGTKAKKQPTT
jgi:hypothetical protein